MTRIYTNVPAMTALSSLNKNMSGLQTALQRLSTGLKINSGKDDPAGLMASEMLRSEITGVQTGIKNTERANMMIAVADSALNEVAGLLNDIRGLVTEAANTGAMSREMIEANQLQVDASLKAIDRISASTSFMGRNLLDGSLDFETSGTDRYTLQDLTINEVRFGTDKQPVNVNVKVAAAAKRAELYFNHSVLPDDITLSFGGNLGYATESFKKGTTVQEIATVVNRQTSSTGVVAEVASDAIAGQLYVSSLGPGNDIIIQAGQTGTDAGCVDVKFLEGTSEGIKVEYEPSLGSGYPAKLNVYLQTAEWLKAVADDVDNSVYTATGLPYHDNTALKFIANITGDQYNGASIQYVDGAKTQAAWGADTTNPTGTKELPYAYFNDAATKATALMGDVNGMTMASSVGLSNGQYLTFTATAAGAQYNNTAINIVNGSAGGGVIPLGERAGAVYNAKDGTLSIQVEATATFEDIRNALIRDGNFSVAFSEQTIAGLLVTVATGTTVTTNTQNSGGDAGTLFIVLPPDDGSDGTGTGLTAQGIVDLFDLNNTASRGSERAASLFTVERTADNTGDGYICLYQQSVNTNNGHVSDPTKSDDELGITRKTTFKSAFSGGQSGDHIVSTANEVVTALNNSEYWGSIMCTSLLASLKIDNDGGIYYDATNPPPILARLSPGDHGLGIVSAFAEVAYSGSPDDGTGIQFLGPEGSPNVRYVADPKGNSELWIDTTTDPDIVDFASAVLNAKNPDASVVITARKKGEQYDDVLFQIKKATDDMVNAGPNRKDGWVEYDPGESYAEAELIFRNSTNNTVLLDTAFTVTANERGDMANNTAITMKAITGQVERVKVTINSITGGLDITLNSGLLDPNPTSPYPSGVSAIDANEVIKAINDAKLGFTATLSQSNSEDWSKLAGAGNYSDVNTGKGTFENLGLTAQSMTVGNTGSTGGHKGTVTIWMTNIEDTATTQRPPTAQDLINLITKDAVVNQMFTATNYTNTSSAGTGAIDFVYDGPLVSGGGLVHRGTMMVHLVTSPDGLVQTTARDLVEWWNKQDPDYVKNISASLLRRPTDAWDECNDDGGFGLLQPTVSDGLCDIVFDDISFVGWGEDCDEPFNYISNYARGTMTSENGINATYDLVAKRPGSDYDGYSIIYVQDNNVTGAFNDNLITSTKLDECGNLIVPTSMTQDGLFLELDNRTKEIAIHINQGVTTAYDIKQLIENDPITKLLFAVELKGPSVGGDGLGNGTVTVDDDTLLTKGGTSAPGSLNGAKLLFGKDEEDWQLVFKSEGYGGRQFVDIQGIITNGRGATLDTRLADGTQAERSYGQDAEVTINGVKAVADGWDISTVDSTLSLSFVMSDNTQSGYETSFKILGGGATFQLGPAVVSNQQVTIGIQAINTVKLGGTSGRLYQLATGKDADLYTDTNKAYRIVEEAIIAVTAIRGRFGALQKTTFDTNANVLSDTLEALVAAESQIRDADFAEETANLTRAQVLIQSNVNTLGIANQLPNYMLGLLG